MEFFPCEYKLATGKEYDLKYSLQDLKAEVWINDVKECRKTFSKKKIQKATRFLPAANVYASSNFHPAANAELWGLKHYSTSATKHYKWKLQKTNKPAKGNRLNGKIENGPYFDLLWSMTPLEPSTSGKGNVLSIQKSGESLFRVFLEGLKFRFLHGGGGGGAWFWCDDYEMVFGKEYDVKYSLRMLKAEVWINGKKACEKTLPEKAIEKAVRHLNDVDFYASSNFHAPANVELWNLNYYVKEAK